MPRKTHLFNFKPLQGPIGLDALDGAECWATLNGKVFKLHFDGVDVSVQGAGTPQELAAVTRVFNTLLSTIAEGGTWEN